jgi:hypothetical protein
VGHALTSFCRRDVKGALTCLPLAVVQVHKKTLLINSQNYASTEKKSTRKNLQIRGQVGKSAG